MDNEPTAVCLSNLKIALVAEHASIDFGGEAAIPCHYYRELLSQGLDVHLIVHERSLPFLQKTFPNELARVHTIRDSWLHRSLFLLQRPLPARVSYITVGYLLRSLTQYFQCRILRRLIAEDKINLVHQITPVSPREPSMLYNLGVPVMIGPMNGGMKYPEAFKAQEGPMIRRAIEIARVMSEWMNRWIPGKRDAKLILVANERTRLALPECVQGRVEMMVENGCDFRLWQHNQQGHREEEAISLNNDGIPTFIFVGRLVDWKGVDILLEAFAAASNDTAMRLRIIGDGPMRGKLELLANCVRKQDSRNCEIHFYGWLDQKQIACHFKDARALVLLSLYECGGAVVLEGMAAGLPVIATNWGGPADYLDETTGILIDPISREQMVIDAAAAIKRLALDQTLTLAIGERAMRKSRELFDWREKSRWILERYVQLVGTESSNTPQIGEVAE